MRESSRHVRLLGRVCRKTTTGRWPSSCRGDSSKILAKPGRIAPTETHIRPLCSLTPCQSDYLRNRLAIRVRSGSERLFRCSPGAPLGDFIGSASEESQLQKAEIPPFGFAPVRFLPSASLRFACACATLDSPPGLAGAGGMTIPVFRRSPFLHYYLRDYLRNIPWRWQPYPLFAWLPLSSFTICTAF